MSELSSSKTLCSPQQLRCNAETCDELKQGPFANDFRWAADEIDRLRAALTSIKSMAASARQTMIASNILETARKALAGAAPETSDESVGCGNCAEAHQVLSAAGIADGDLAEKIDDLVSERDSAVEEFERYKKALQTANGFLIMNNLEREAGVRSESQRGTIMSGDHNRSRMLVWAEIDGGIQDAVRQLMEMPGVLTHTSCQGGNGGGPCPEYPPYVMVTWKDDMARARIVEHFDLTEEGDHWAYAHPRHSLNGNV